MLAVSRMSVEAISDVLWHSKATGTAKVVLIGIANHHGDGGAWPSEATLARYAGVDPRNVRKALRQLEALGELRVIIQGGGSRHTKRGQRPNRYELLVHCPPWCDGSRQHRDTRQFEPGLWDPTPDASVPRTPDASVPRTVIGTTQGTSTGTVRGGCGCHSSHGDSCASEE